MTSKVYVFPDPENRILRIEGQYTLPDDLSGWVLIEEGEPCDRLNLAQSHYFAGGLYTEDGIPRWKLNGCLPELRSDTEITADQNDPAVSPETEPVTWDALAKAIQEGVNSI